MIVFYGYRKSIEKVHVLMDKIKRYLDIAVPTETCNFRCHYCYITHHRKFNNKIIPLSHSKETIRAALSRQRLGGKCLINLCAGGETLLSQDILPIVRELLEEEHYVVIVTNGSLQKRFQEITEFPDELLKHLFIKFSFHYLELIRLNLLDVFFNNVGLMKQHKVSFTVELTPADELIPEIENIKKICMERLGALCHVTIARDERTTGFNILTKYSPEEYRKIWSVFDSQLFDFKYSLYGQKRHEFCYAGDWSAYIDLRTGTMQKCYSCGTFGNLFANTNTPIKWEAIGENCPFPYCFNGHSWLALGSIPELHTPCYANIRNRICADGSEWLSPEINSFLRGKLIDENKQYGCLKKSKIALSSFLRQQTIIQQLYRKIFFPVRWIKKHINSFSK